MSFDINWEIIHTDEDLKDQLKDFLNDRLSSINLPKYMDNLQVVAVDLGTKPPELSIRDIDFPFDEFYGDDSSGSTFSVRHSRRQHSVTNISRSPSPILHQSRLASPIPMGSTTGLLMARPGSPYLQGLHNGVGIGAFGLKEAENRENSISTTVPSSPSSSSLLPRNENDLQLTLDLQWDSRIYIEVTCNLVVNYPYPGFITLPVRLKISNLQIHSLAVCAYLDHRVFLSFLCDLDDDSQDSNSRQGSRNPSVTDTSNFLNPDTRRFDGGDRMDIIKDLKIEGELGDYEGENEDEINIPLPTGTLSAQHIQRSATSMSTSESTATETLNSGSVLRNIGKIEKFMISALRKLLIRELGWPNWIEIDTRDEDEEGSEDSGEE